jgi:hypothetical protein
MQLVIQHRFRYMTVVVLSFSYVTSTRSLIVVQRKGEQYSLLKSRFYFPHTPKTVVMFTQFLFYFFFPFAHCFPIE